MLTLAYFVRIFERVFRHTPTASEARLVEIPIQIKLSLGFTSVAIMALGLWSDPIVGSLIREALPPGL
jgi:NADH:ubiquinone oxidoreductase subunit 5 (subunit L)/multisubunit Na+/H+ antiporter MnhA subunit